MTWEFGGSVGWVDVYLAESGDDTTLRLEHVGLVDDFDDKWDEFGPGAVGVGWDLSLVGLGEHLATGADLDPNADQPRIVGRHAPQQRRMGAGVDRLRHAARAGRGSRHPHCRVLHRRLMHAFDVLGDPVRRRILELIVDDELTSGAITRIVQDEFGISQPAVSQHLRVLRDAGFVRVRADGARRHYTLDAAPLRGVDAWLAPFRQVWEQRLDALGTEIARGKRARRRA